MAEPLYLLTDTAIVGHLGTDALAGLAVASSVLLVGYSIFIFLAYGTTAAVARLLGAGDQREAAHQAVQGMWLAAGIGVVLVVLGGLFADPLIRAVLVTGAGITWLWAGIALFMLTRLVTLAIRRRGTAWAVTRATR